MKRLRAALGDDADNPRFVETLPRRGYRFIGALEAEGERQGLRTQRAASGGAAVHEPERRRIAGILHRRADRGDDRAARTALPRPHRRHRALVVDGRSRARTQRAREIGQALRADYLLEGSVRREGDRVRITARLVETAGETHLWAETYERHLTDCLSVQADVAARIAESLALELVPETSAADGHNIAASTSASAYQEYLKAATTGTTGRPDVDSLGADDEGLEQALSSFDEALRIDPHFAPAYAGLSRAHIARAVHYREQPRRVLETARDGGEACARARARALRSPSRACRCSPHARVGLARRRGRLRAGDRAESEPGERAPWLRRHADGRCREPTRRFANRIVPASSIPSAWSSTPTRRGCATWPATTRRRSNAAAVRRNWIHSTFPHGG